MSTLRKIFKAAVTQNLGVALAIAAIFALSSYGAAQGNVPDRVAVKVADPSRPVSISAHLLNGSITVHAYNGNDVTVEARVREGERHEDAAAGRPHHIQIRSTGLTVDADNNTVIVGADSTSRTIDLTLQVPVRSNLDLKTVNDGDIHVTGVDGEIDVDDINGGVTLSDVSGTAVAHALNDGIKASFRRVNPQKPMAFSSLNGDIDVTLPADTRANLSFENQQGELYSDFDIQLNANAHRPIVEDERSQGGHYRVRIDKTVRGTINGGGPEISFKNFNGNIYIRKASASAAR